MPPPGGDDPERTTDGVDEPPTLPVCAFALAGCRPRQVPVFVKDLLTNIHTFDTQKPQTSLTMNS